MKHFNNYDEYLQHWLFKAMRKTALDKAKGKCQKCGAWATEVHHTRYPKPWGAFDTPDNLLPVCHACHCKIEGKLA